MFKFKALTDLEKLLFAESYIKELKLKIEEHKAMESVAINNLRLFIAEVRAFSKKGSRLMSYKREVADAHAKNRKITTQRDKLERKNFLLREKVRELEEALKTY
jgi:hypothetical protein